MRITIRKLKNKFKSSEMKFIKTSLQDLYLVQINSLKDDRGFFARTFCKEEFLAIGFNQEFVQFNHSFNTLKGTIRGMHYQKPPFAETKLIRCVQGRVYDVAVDLRKNSPTYLQSFGAELSDENLTCILIPQGFAHGFQTLENNTSLIYHHTNFFTPNTEGGIRYNDPALGIQWKLPVASISPRDLIHPLINKNFQAITL
jgi:dTDP-4-dehydrorhamnose 3,5-epimerase